MPGSRMGGWGWDLNSSRYTLLTELPLQPLEPTSSPKEPMGQMK